MIVWGMAAALSIISIWGGVARAYVRGEFNFKPVHLIPILAIPIFLIGATAVLLARRKKP
jgi:hypothetical protein